MELFKDYQLEKSNGEKDLLNVKEASDWASDYLRKNVTPSNISYLIQYGKVKKYGDNGDVLISKNELIEYYDKYYDKKILSGKKKLGDDLNWKLSFDELREVDTTKHVHRLHPYKGKFIPHLVQYFLDGHKDEYKKRVFFNKFCSLII